MSAAAQHETRTAPGTKYRVDVPDDANEDPSIYVSIEDGTVTLMLNELEEIVSFARFHAGLD